MQLSLLQGLDEKRHKKWEKYYVTSECLTPILFEHYDEKGHRHQSVTDRFVGALDDEVDKSVVFFLDQQGQIARELWALSTWILHSNTLEQTSTLYDHAVHLLREARGSSPSACAAECIVQYRFWKPAWVKMSKNYNN